MFSSSDREPISDSKCRKKEKRDQGWNKKVHTLKLKKNLKGNERGQVGNWKDMKRRMNQKQKDMGNLNLFDENANKGKND